MLLFLSVLLDLTFLSNKIKNTKFLILSFIFKFLNSLKFSAISKGLEIVGVSIFRTFFIWNTSSIYPYVFPSSLLTGPVLTFRLTLWTGLVAISIFKNTRGTIEHLIPEGTPMALVPFIFVIELVSNLIRPITLMIRIVANILAGHVFISLTSSLVTLFKPALTILLTLNLAEFFVAIIQSYIFITLIILYANEQK